MANFHQRTLHSFTELCGAMGYGHSDQLSPSDIFRRYEQHLMHFDDIFMPLEKGQLLHNDAPSVYTVDWKKASAERF